MNAIKPDHLHLARPYAQAAFEYAQEAQILETWSKELEFLSLCMQDTQMIEVLKDPRHSKSIEALVFSLGKDQFSPAMKSFLKLLVENKRLNVLPEIYTLFESLRADAQKRLQVTVTAAMHLSDTQMEQLKKYLERDSDSQIDISQEIDASLLGGFIIKAGDRTLDYSLSRRFVQMEEALMA